MRGQGGRVNEGQCRALRKSATVQKLKPEDFNFYDNVSNFLLLDAGADGRGVARPYFVQGRYFMRKFKDRVRRGPLTRPSTLATVGGRCLLFTDMEELSSSSAQRAASTS